MRTGQRPQVFISYASKDQDQASDLFERLCRMTSEFDFFLAAEQIRPGDDWERKIHSALRESVAFVPIITRNWKKSRWCFGEWVTARTVSNVEFFIPIKSKGIKIKNELGKFQFLEIDDDGQYVSELFATLKRKINPRRAKIDFSVPPIPDAFNYAPSQRAIFRGRDDDIQNIRLMLDEIDRAESDGVMIVHGASGSGKSAVVHAGLFPELNDAESNWVPIPLFSLRHEPFNELLNKLRLQLEPFNLVNDNITELELSVDVERPDETVKCWETIHHALPENRKLLLIVDQIEEAILRKDEPQFSALLKVVSTAIKARGVAVLVIARSDQLNALSAILDVPSSRRTSVLILPLSKTELVNSMNEVLKDTGYEYDQMLVSKILDELDNDMDAWRLVGCALYDLWRTEPEVSRKRAFKLSRYQGITRVETYIENIQEMLGADAEIFYDFLAIEGVRLIDKSRIVTTPIRREIIPEQFISVVDQLVAHSLFIAKRNDLLESAVEAVRVVITDYWSQLDIVNRATRLREIRSGRTAAQIWEEHDRNCEWLIHRGKRLLKLHEGLENHTASNELLREYVNKCKSEFE